MSKQSHLNLPGFAWTLSLILILFSFSGWAENHRNLPPTSGNTSSAPEAESSSGAREDKINRIMQRRRALINAGASEGFSVPEVTDKPAPRQTLLDINVLKYVFIDPKTHAVTFVGKYDPAYDTGPIPYSELLTEALNNPYPAFSLEPNNQENLKVVQQMDQMVSADLERMKAPAYCTQWGQKLSDLLLHDPNLKADRKRFFDNCARALGVSGEELTRVFDAATGKIQMEPSELFSTVTKMMNALGKPEAAGAFAALAKGGSPEEILRNMAGPLGVSEQFGALESRYNSGSLSPEQFRREGIVLCIAELCRRLGAPESQLQNLVASVRSGAQETNALTAYMGEQLNNLILNQAGGQMLNGLVLGPEVISRFYRLPVPKSELVFENVAPNSLLGDILFKSDYRMKSLCVYPDARDKVPGHLTEMEFMQKAALDRHYDLPAGSGAELGHRLIPSEVKMKISPNRETVEFEDAKVKIIGWVRGGFTSSDRTANDFINSLTPRYAEFLTANYDEYAKIYPEWHKLSEAAKIIALARWAKQNNFSLQAQNATGAKIDQPKWVEGFWAAVFQVNGEKASLTVMEEGGASFSDQEGEAWIQPQTDSTFTNDVYTQLAAGAILAEQAAGAALSGDMEDARDLADKSARALTGDIDLTKLPGLDQVPLPGEPQAYAEATGEAINQAGDCLRTMAEVQQDLVKAQQLEATNPQEAARLTQEAAQKQEAAQVKLKEIMDNVAAYKSNPSQAGQALVNLQGKTGSVTPVNPPPIFTQQPQAGQSAAAQPAPSPQTKQPEENWSEKCSQWRTELEQVNRKIEDTQKVLRRLNASILGDRKLFSQWESDADAGFDRCVNMASDVVVDFGAGALADRYDEINNVAKNLPYKDAVEKYRYLTSLAHRLKEAKSTKDLDELAKKENKTVPELFETIRDGIGQINGLLGLDKTVPGAVWKYGQLSCDMAYNLTELRQLWKNTATLEGNNARYAEAVQKLTEMMQKLVKRQQELKQKIDRGESVTF